MTAQIQHRLFPEFAGVALADILANGVAIIILMIVITMMIKHEQEEKRLEQVEDVSVLLSRDIATSAVMNALPTSPPARLHDYRISPLDRNPTHRIMPVIEIHRNHVRNYYSGETVSREHLLLQNNALDRYLKKLNRIQRSYLRMDIYDIQLFYIVMSILKDYDARPNHWHFIGYPDGGGSTGNGGEGNGNQPKEESLFEDEEAEGTWHQAGDGKAVGAKQTQRQNQDDQQGVPQSAGLDPSASGLDNYPYDDLAYQSGASRQQPPKDLPGSLSTPANEWTETSDGIFGALAQMMTKGTPGGFGRPETRISRFRTARASNDNNRRTGQEEQEARSIDAGSMRLLLPALFEFMHQIQEEADAGGATRLAEYNFVRDLLPLLEQQQVGNSPPKLERLFDQLDALLRVTPDETDATPMVKQQTNRTLRGNALSMLLNDRISEVTLTGNDTQDKREDLPAEVATTLHFSLYPTIYQGVRAPIKKHALLLMHPEQKAPDEFRWRVVTLVSPAVDDFMTAFVYSALGEEGQLLLAAEENALNIADYRVTTNYPITRFRNERWLMMIYGIPALLLTLSVLRRGRKTA